MGKSDISTIVMRVILIPCIVLLSVTIGVLIAGMFTDVTPFLARVLPAGFDTQRFISFMTRLFVIFVCFPIHESAHAWTASKLGDNTAKMRGRISLNPFRHLDLLGTIMILIAGIGYAKPVPVNSNNFNNRKAGMALTALAGPLSNMLMSVLVLVGIRFLVRSGNTGSYGLIQFLIYVSYINVALAIFNLIPIPPLDGSKVFGIVLPDDAYNWLLHKGQAAVMILLVAIMVMSRTGFNPIGELSARAFNALYSVIVI